MKLHSAITPSGMASHEVNISAAAMCMYHTHTNPAFQNVETGSAAAAALPEQYYDESQSLQYSTGRLLYQLAIATDSVQGHLFSQYSA